MDRGYLTQEEIDIISENLRPSDWSISGFFIFSCYTGLCYADVRVSPLTDEEKPDGSLGSCPPPKRTPRSMSACKSFRYHKQISRSGTGNHVLHSNQKTNAYLKRYRHLRIQKAVTFHMARHLRLQSPSAMVSPLKVSQRCSAIQTSRPRICARIGPEDRGDMKMLAVRLTDATPALLNHQRKLRAQQV